MVAQVSDLQWIIGFSIAGAVVVVVVLLVGTIIYLASQIKKEAVAILAALQEARENTESLWDVETTNAVAEDILEAARTARAALGG